jgi:hypothetical protein
MYDEATLDRIERKAAGPSADRARPSAVRRHAASTAVAAAALLGVREAVESPVRHRLEEVDPWADGGANPRVRFHWHPSPPRSVAEVLW